MCFMTGIMYARDFFRICAVGSLGESQKDNCDESLGLLALDIQKSGFF